MNRRKKRISGPSSCSECKEDLDLGPLHYLVVKEADVEGRLAGSFIALVKTADGSVLLGGGNVVSRQFSNAHFRCIYIGASDGDLREANNILDAIRSSVSRNFSSDDFHAKIAADILADYLRSVLQDIEVPRAPAVEFILSDFRNNLFIVRYTGDVERYDFDDEGAGRIFIAGCYNDQLRACLTKELAKISDKPSDGEIRTVIQRIVARFPFGKTSFCY